MPKVSLSEYSRYMKIDWPQSFVPSTTVAIYMLLLQIVEEND